MSRNLHLLNLAFSQRGGLSEQRLSIVIGLVGGRSDVLSFKCVLVVRS